MAAADPARSIQARPRLQLFINCCILATMFDLTKNLKDASYVLIGLGVIGYQKAAEQGKQLRARLDDQRVQLDKQVKETQAQLTKRAEELVTQTREAALQAQANLRTRITSRAA